VFRSAVRFRYQETVIFLKLPSPKRDQRKLW